MKFGVLMRVHQSSLLLWLTLCLVMCLSASAAAVPATYTYDAAGRLATEYVGNVRVEYAYDLNGNLLSQVSCTADCFIAGECYIAGDGNPADVCEVCDPTTPDAWTAVVDCGGTDMGPGGDTGTQPDMGTPQPDAGSTGSDMGGVGSPDTGGPGTADLGGVGGLSDEDKGGCSCSVGPGSLDGWPLLFVGLIWLRRRRRRGTATGKLATLSGVAFCTLAGISTAEAITVCPDGSCDEQTIAAGISNASAGETILVKPEIYKESNLSLNGKNLESMTPNDASGVIIDAERNGVAISANNATIRGITVRNGFNTGSPGGGIRAGGTMVLENVVVEDSEADNVGGGIGTNSGGELTVIDCIIRNNTAKNAGGGIGGGFRRLLVIRSRIENNKAVAQFASAGGGGIDGRSSTFSAEYLEIRDSVIQGNRAVASGSGSGGGLRTRTPTTIVRNTSFVGNTAEGTNGTGGGIDVGSGATTTLQNITVMGNTAVQGGGVYLGSGGGDLIVSGGSISGNTATAIGDGGGFFCAAASRLVGLTAGISGNSPDQIAGCGQCTLAATQACATSLPGPCAAGEQVCAANGLWELCEPLVAVSGPETMCSDTIDDDCDGKTDAADPDCQPARPLTRSQVSGPSGRKGDPVNTFTGEFYMKVPADLEVDGPLPLRFERYYASGLETLGRSGVLGTNWRHNFEWSLDDGGTTVFAAVTDADGRTIEFNRPLNTSRWVLDQFTDVSFSLTSVGNGHLLYDPRSSLFYSFDSTGALAEISDGTQNALTLSYTAGELTQVSSDLGLILSFTYDAGGLLDSVSDGTRTVVFTHTANDLTGMIDVSSGSTTYTYATGGLLTSTTLPEGNTPITQVFEATGRVMSQTDPDANTTTFAYDDVAGTCTITDPASGATVHTHDIRGRLLQVQDPGGGTLRMGYDGAGRRDSVTDAGGGVTLTAFNQSSEHPTRFTFPGGMVVTLDMIERFDQGEFRTEVGAINYADGTSEQLAYDSVGNLVEMIDRAGSTSLFAYNDRGQSTSVTNQAGGTTTFAYDAAGLLGSERDNAGNQTSYTYDTLSRRTDTFYPDGSLSTATYDAASRITSTTDERGNVATYLYDANGNVTSLTDREGKTTIVAWDAQDRFESYTDPLGNIASVTYDSLGRLDSQTNRTGGISTLQYDPDGRVVAMVDAAGETWARTYQADGLLDSVSDPLGNTISYQRDGAGRIEVVRTPMGNETIFTYDVLGRTATVTGPLADVTSLSYDARGFITQQSTSGGVTATYARNVLGQVTSITDPNGSIWAFDFDTAGRLLSRTDPLGNQISRTFDVRNRPNAWVLPGSLGFVNVIHDAFGNVTSQAYSAGPNLSFTYDKRNMLTATEALTLGYDDNGLVISSNGLALTRDAGGRLETVTYAAGKAVTYLYDSADNLVQIDDWLGNITAFEYDAAGRRTSIARANGVTTAVGYNADNNVTSVDESTMAAALSGIALTRDARGNITAATRDLPELPTTPTDFAFTYAAGAQVSGFTYDALGRLQTDDTRTYLWDGASRLTSYTEGGSTVSFTHNGLFHVASRTEGGTTDEFVWNHSTTRGSMAAVRRDGSDYRYYVYTDDGELLYSIDAATDSGAYFHFDEMGNTLFLTDDGGAVTDTYAYTAYGEITASSGMSDNPFTFVGQYGVMREGSTGLYLMGRRFYDSESKRFISREPVVDMMHPKLTNPYAYAVGNPLRYIDPTGESGEDKSGGSPVPDGVKTVVKATNLTAKGAGKVVDAAMAKSADVIDAATGANRINRVWGTKNPEWVDSALDHSKKLKKYKGRVEKLGKLGKLAKLGVAGAEGKRAVAEFAAEELAEKIGGKGIGKLVGIGVEGIKTKERVDKVQSQLKTEQWSNVQNFYRAMDNSLESLRAKLIKEDEFLRRVKVAQETFDMSVEAARSSGVFGILQESAEGTKKMLLTFIGL